MDTNQSQEFMDHICWSKDNLLPAIAQDHLSNEVLMVAWMNPEALKLTVAEQRGIYWSRSRQKIWRKGEESGHVQLVKEIRIDCDQDVILLKVEQLGSIACHTGRHNCFYRKLENGVWKTTDEVVKDPNEIYKK